MTAARSLSRSPTQMHYAQLYKAPYIAKAKLNYSRLACTCAWACLGPHRLCVKRVRRERQRQRESMLRVLRLPLPACLPMPVCATRARACTRALVSHRRFPFRPLVVVSSRPPFSVSVSALTSPCAMCRYSYRRLVSSGCVFTDAL